MSDEQRNLGGRPTTHATYSLMQKVDARTLSPELARELTESARELLAGDGAWEQQPRRRQRLAHRLACLELYLDSIDAFILERASVFVPVGEPVRTPSNRRVAVAGPGEPLPVFRLYLGLFNAYRRTCEALGLDARRPESVPTLEQYLATRETSTASTTTGNAPTCDASAAAQTEPSTGAGNAPEGEQ